MSALEAAGSDGAGAGSAAGPDWLAEPPTDHNEEVCGACFDAGDLMCCESCPAAFHIKCAGYGEHCHWGATPAPRVANAGGARPQRRVSSAHAAMGTDPRRAACAP